MDNQKEIQKLNWRIEWLEESVKEQREVLDLYKILSDDKAIYVNTFTRDCDGVESYNSYKITDINEYFSHKRYFHEQDFEGSYSWDVVKQKDAHEDEDCGTFGQGWGIN